MTCTTVLDLQLPKTNDKTTTVTNDNNHDSIIKTDAIKKKRRKRRNRKRPSNTNGKVFLTSFKKKAWTHSSMNKSKEKESTMNENKDHPQNENIMRGIIDEQINSKQKQWLNYQQLLHEQQQIAQENPRALKDLLFNDSLSLEQQMIDEVLQLSQKTSSEIQKNTNEAQAKNIYQESNDYLIAVNLQKAEQNAYYSRKRNNSNTNHVKVSFIDSISRIPKSALDFTFDEDDISSLNEKIESKKEMVREMTKGGKKNQKRACNFITKHDGKNCSRKNILRLNQYSNCGNLDEQSMHIGNRAFNSIRNDLDKKGFVDYSFYQL